MERLKILIIDDEEIVHTDLSFFDWEGAGCTVVGNAYNGEQALELCENFLPDICFVDVTMPVMDGLTFIKTASSKYPLMQFILLTCHTEFQFVQQAIRLGASDYILKVCITDDEISQALDKAIKGKLEKENAKIRLHQSELISLGQEIQLWFEEKNDIFFPDKKIVYPSTFLGFCRVTGSSVYEDERFKDKLLSQSWVPITDRCFLKIVPQKSINSINTKLIEVMKEYLTLGQNFVGYIGLVSDGKNIWKELDLLKKLDEIYFYEHRQILFLYDSYNYASLMKDIDLSSINAKFQSEIRSSSTFHNFLTTEFSIFLLKMRPAIETLRSFLLTKISLMASLLSNEKNQVDLVRVIMSSYTLKGLVTGLVEITGKTTISSDKKIRREIFLAQSFIHENFHKTISLNDISELVGLSSSYLSRIFSSETGWSFNDYVVNYRMNKAIEFLITRPELKIYEVADAVGIGNYRYFSTIFKEYTGMTPKRFQSGLT